jgi:hypothetical protein
MKAWRAEGTTAKKTEHCSFIKFYCPGGGGQWNIHNTGQAEERGKTTGKLKSQGEAN